MQDYIKINGTVIHQPEEGLGYSFETKYSEDTKRVQSGKLKASAMFTVEQLSYSGVNLTVEEMKTILQLIGKGGNITLHYFSPYYGAWRDGTFYVGKGSLSVARLSEDSESYDSISFNMTGVNPI